VIYLADPDFILYVGDALEVLRGLPDESVHCCVTSPPYWGLRDYGSEGQLGLEATPDLYVAAMVEVFREVRRVLRADGTVWLNLGDSYVSTGAGNQGENGQMADRAVSKVRGSQVRDGKAVHGDVLRPFSVEGLPPKNLVGIPWRVAFALQADGWYLRSDIVWSKPNPMPESVTDRPTKAHEYVFLLSRSPRYYYDAAAIAEPASWFGPNGQPKDGPHAGQMQARAGAKRPQMRRAAELAKQHGLTDAHFEAIRAVGISDVGQAVALREQGDWGNGSTSTENLRLVSEAKDALGGYYREFLIPLTRNARSVWTIQTQQYADAHFAVYPEALVEPCIKAGCPIGGTVLDPFMGSGTTALVARKLGRKSLGIELNAEYAALTARRLSQLSLLADAAASGQTDIFEMLKSAA
jgi:DNA modification methylase